MLKKTGKVFMLVLTLTVITNIVTFPAFASAVERTALPTKDISANNSEIDISVEPVESVNSEVEYGLNSTQDVITMEWADNKISAGANHSLVILPDGTLWAWGANEFGQLGDGTTIDRNRPVRVGNRADWVFISAGTDYSIGIRSDGTVWSWGSNFYGQLGISVDRIDQRSPAQVSDLTDMVYVSAGSTHSLAIRSDGTLWGWGDLDGTQSLGWKPKQIGDDSNWISVSAGCLHSP